MGLCAPNYRGAVLVIPNKEQNWSTDIQLDWPSHCLAMEMNSSSFPAASTRQTTSAHCQACAHARASIKLLSKACVVRRCADVTMAPTAGVLPGDQGGPVHQFTRKSTYTSFELFKREGTGQSLHGGPVSCPPRLRRIVDFAWEPQGDSLALQVLYRYSQDRFHCSHPPQL